VIAKPKILIVEDELSVAMTMRFLLGLAGCEAEIAGNREIAMEMAETGRFDLITLDVNLRGTGGANGFDICIELKQNPRLRDIPVVFVSGGASLEYQQRGLDAGAVDYITKPFETFEFAPRLLSHVKSNCAHA
jgi:CheY-like chemotaxis protein